LQHGPAVIVELKVFDVDQDIFGQSGFLNKSGDFSRLGRQHLATGDAKFRKI